MGGWEDTLVGWEGSLAEREGSLAEWEGSQFLPLVPVAGLVNIRILRSILK